jgi:hypothetical protein
MSIATVWYLSHFRFQQNSELMTLSGVIMSLPTQYGGYETFRPCAPSLSSAHRRLNGSWLI